MKINTLTLVFALIVITSNAQWMFQNPKPAGNSLLSVAFTSEMIGYACGSNGTIIKTEDGGNTWRQLVSGTTSNLNSVYFIDSETGYAVGGTGEYYQDNYSIILKTIDGGDSWTVVYNQKVIGGPFGAPFYSVFFTSPDIGYVVGFENNLKTVDGGYTWSPMPLEGYFRSVFFTTAEKGYVVGWQGQISETTDGGNSWEDNFIDAGYYLLSVFFTDESTGYIACSGGVILKTVNGGLSWIQNHPTANNLYSIYFISQDTGYASGSNGTVLKTINAGNTWSPIMTGSNEYLYSVYMNGSGSGCAVGGGWNQDCTILYTQNEGQTWVDKTSSITDRQLSSVYFVNAQDGFIAGDSGMILITNDAGTTWIDRSGATTHNLNSVFFPDASTGYAAGDSGTIIKTTDGGESWFELVSGTGYDLNSICFTDANTGFAVGEESTFLKSTNGGITWNKAFTELTSLKSLFFTNQDTGYIAGINKIMQSVDGGNTWDPILVNWCTDFSSVYFTDSDHGFAVGTYYCNEDISGIIYRTTNGGVSWDTKYFFRNTLNSVYFTDNTNGYVTCGSGLLATHDGGDTWQYDANSNYTLNSVFFSPEAGYTVGAKGTILSLPGDIVTSVPALQPFAQENINIYPNPAYGKLTIAGNEKTEYSIISIFNITGQLVLSTPINSGQTLELDVHQLSRGVYMVKVQSQSVLDIRKIILR